MSQTRCKNLLNQKLVSGAVDGDDVSRRARIVFDLLPQLGNVRIHSAAEGKAVVAPHSVEQLAARDCLSPASAEILEDFVLARREVDGLAGLFGQVLAEIDDHIPKLQDPRVAAFRCRTSEDHLDPRHQLESRGQAWNIQ